MVNMKIPKRSSLVVALLIAVVVSGFGVTSASAASGWYQIKNSYSNKCMDNWDSSTSATQIRQYACLDISPQMWRTIYVSGDPDRHWDVIQNEFSGMCLDVWQGKSYTQGQPIVQYPCNSNDLAENLYSTIAGYNSGGWIRTLSAVCVLSCKYGYGVPTNYLASVPSTANNATVTITYNSGSSRQEWQGAGL
jgi:hypothetical protein